MCILWMENRLTSLWIFHCMVAMQGVGRFFSPAECLSSHCSMLGPELIDLWCHRCSAEIGDICFDKKWFVFAFIFLRYVPGSLDLINSEKAVGCAGAEYLVKYIYRSSATLPTFDSNFLIDDIYTWGSFDWVVFSPAIFNAWRREVVWDAERDQGRGRFKLGDLIMKMGVCRHDHLNPWSCQGWTWRLWPGEKISVDSKFLDVAD